MPGKCTNLHCFFLSFFLLESSFLSGLISSRMMRTNLLQDKRFRGGDRVQIHNHESHSWFGPPFASCEVMRSHYGPLGRTRGANPPDLSSIPGPCTSLHFFFLSSGAHPPVASSNPRSFRDGDPNWCSSTRSPVRIPSFQIFFLYPFFSNHSSFGQTIHGG